MELANQSSLRTKTPSIDREKRKQVILELAGKNLRGFNETQVAAAGKEIKGVFFLLKTRGLQGGRQYCWHCLLLLMHAVYVVVSLPDLVAICVQIRVEGLRTDNACEGVFVSSSSNSLGTFTPDAWWDSRFPNPKDENDNLECQTECGGPVR